MLRSRMLIPSLETEPLGSRRAPFSSAGRKPGSAKAHRLRAARSGPTTILDLCLEGHFLQRAGAELLYLADRFGLVGEEVQLRLGVPSQFDRAVVQPVVDPVQ